MGLCACKEDKVIQTHDNLIRELVTTAVEDWFILGLPFDELPLTVSKILLGSISLTCDALIETITLKMTNDCIDRIFVLKAIANLSNVILWLTRIYKECVTAILRDKITQTLIHIVEIKERADLAEEMEVVRQMVLEHLQNLAVSEEKKSKHTNSPRSLSRLFLEREQELAHEKKLQNREWCQNLTVVPKVPSEYQSSSFSEPQHFIHFNHDLSPESSWIRHSDTAPSAPSSSRNSPRATISHFSEL